jgi:pyrroline-5-carboxylate reductase
MSTTAAPAFAAAAIGFIGTGTISVAMVEGIATCATPPKSIIVSPRNAANAAALAAKFPALVTVAADNQGVVDASDWVFLAVRPQVTDAVVAPLRFRKEQTLVTVIASKTNAQLAAASGDQSIDAATIVRAVPLPPVATHSGVTAMSPPHADVEAFFNALGRAVAFADEQALTEAMPVACQMGPFFQWMSTVVGWLKVQGVDDAAAAAYTAGTFKSIADEAVAAVGVDGSGGQAAIDALVASQTPGGLNECAIQDLTRDAAFTAVDASLTSTLQRLTGKVALTKKE